MKIDAILFTSQTGFSAKYASLLGETLQVPVYSVKEAKKGNLLNLQVIYVGWLMGGLVRGLAWVKKKHRVVAVCAVGLGESGSQLESIRKMNQLEEALPVFSLQGGYRENDLPMPYRWIMQPVKKSLIRQLSKKKERSPGEERSLVLLQSGGDCVDSEAIRPVLALF